MENREIADITERLRAQTSSVVLGQAEAVRLLMIALLSEGHVLLEGVPGTAKTMLARVFAAGLQLQFKRIQFTPDLMPGDVIGTNIFNFQTNEFVLTRGPIFTEILLADEINRTPPKTQAALLQAMQERTVTIDGKDHPLGPGFMVVATQNPIEQEGTYPLPEAQLDRFLFKIVIGYPGRSEMKQMVLLHGQRTAMPRIDDLNLQPVAGLEFFRAAREAVARIRLSEGNIDYIVELIAATQEDPALLLGGSPRAANMLAVAARASAALDGRDFVIPDDIKTLARPLLTHRVVMSPGAGLDGATPASIIDAIIEKTPVPR